MNSYFNVKTLHNFQSERLIYVTWIGEEKCKMLISMQTQNMVNRSHKMET